MNNKEALSQGSPNENPAQILADMPSFEEHLLTLQEKADQPESETVNLADVKEALFNDIKNTSDPLDREYKLAILGDLPNIDKRTDIIEIDKLHSYKDGLSFGDRVNREMKSEGLNKEFSVGPYAFNKISNWNDKKEFSQPFEREKMKNYYKEASERAMAREILSRNSDKDFDSWSEDDKSEVAILSLLPHYNHDINAIILDYVKEERPTFSRVIADNNPDHPYAKLKYGTTSNFLESCKRFYDDREKMDKIKGKAYGNFESDLRSGEFEYRHRESAGNDEFWYATADE